MRTSTRFFVGSSGKKAEFFTLAGRAELKKFSPPVVQAK
jgi:hypothetical protein